MTRLERTIIHWEEQLANAHSGEPMQITSNDCPLCDYYYEHNSIIACTNDKDETCPIAVETGETDCDGSPWHAVNQSLKKVVGVGVGWGKRVPTPKTIPAVEAELAFLKSLPDPEINKSLEPDGGNMYHPHPLQINSGQFWRCAHGKTGWKSEMDWVGCEQCKKDDPAAYLRWNKQP